MKAKFEIGDHVLVIMGADNGAKGEVVGFEGEHLHLVIVRVDGEPKEREFASWQLEKAE